jgi:hypothetical protein
MLHNQAQDFSFYGEQAASVLSWLGIGDPGLGTDVALHNQHFQVRASVLVCVSGIM